MLMKKKILQLFVAALIATTVFAPGLARAATTAQVEDTVKKAYSLCALDSSKYAYSCTKAEELNTVVQGAKAKPASQREAYLDANIDDFEAVRIKVDKSYWYAATEKKINTDGSIATGTDGGTDNCGGVGVSIDVGCDDSNDNPIYVYIRAIVTWLGGLIGLMLVITLIVSGIQYAGSAGNPANITKAKERIFNAMIGLVMYILLAAALRYLIPGIFS
jgi:hypothetical protein